MKKHFSPRDRLDEKGLIARLSSFDAMRDHVMILSDDALQLARTLRL